MRLVINGKTVNVTVLDSITGKTDAEETVYFLNSLSIMADDAARWNEYKYKHIYTDGDTTNRRISKDIYTALDKRHVYDDVR